MFARRIHPPANGADSDPTAESTLSARGPQPLVAPPESAAPGPPAFVTMVAKSVFGISIEQLQEYMQQTGTLLAGYKESLDRIEAELKATRSELSALRQKVTK